MLRCQGPAAGTASCARTGRAEQQNSPRPAVSSLPSMKRTRCRATMAPRRRRLGVSADGGRGDHAVMGKDEFAAGLAAGVETGFAAGSLAVQGQKTETLDLSVGWCLALGRQPACQCRLADCQQLGGKILRRRGKCRVRQGDDRVEPVHRCLEPGCRRHYSTPRSCRRSRASDRFSCMPTLRADRPSARPMSWVK